MQPVPSTNTADEVRTLSLPGYPDGIWGHDPTDRSYDAELWMIGTPNERRPTFRMAADTPRAARRRGSPGTG